MPQDLRRPHLPHQVPAQAGFQDKVPGCKGKLKGNPQIVWGTPSDFETCK